jgi:hypothetical protein
MKKIITLLLLIISINAKANTGDSSLIFKKDYQIKYKVNLNMSNSGNYYEPKDGGLVLLISGLAFTTAAILEGTIHYGTYLGNGPNSPGPYYVKPFIQQFPRNIMLFVGIGFTLTGFGMSINR